MKNRDKFIQGTLLVLNFLAAGYLYLNMGLTVEDWFLFSFNGFLILSVWILKSFSYKRNEKNKKRNLYIRLVTRSVRFVTLIIVIILHSVFYSDLSHYSSILEIILILSYGVILISDVFGFFRESKALR